MSGAADICDLPGGVEDIEDIVGADDVTPRDRYHNKPVPVPRVSRTYRQVERLASVSDTTKLSLSSLVQFLSLIHLPRR